MSRTPAEVADRVGSVFAEVFDRLADWRTSIEARLGTGRDIRPADLDDAWLLTTPDSPIPFSPPLEDSFLPGADRIEASVLERLQVAA